ncbi:hypothetical protein ACTPD5_22515, partial [Clostridioides difficile]
MLEISTDLQVNQPVITVTSNTFISIENYLSILEYEPNLQTYSLAYLLFEELMLSQVLRIYCLSLDLEQILLFPCKL